MKRDHVDPIARAVLYEGYLLYPYRSSALKNQQRFNFGALHPRAYSETQNGVDAWAMQTECLVQGEPNTRLQVVVRFLHLLERTTRKTEESSETAVWQEAVEREVVCDELALVELAQQPRRQTFYFPPEQSQECGGAVVVRDQLAVEGTVVLTSTPIQEGLYRLRVQIHNLTPLADAGACSRAEALRHTLVSTHTILEVTDGAFVSLLDPPESLRTHATQCTNVGAWPVLVGVNGATEMMLSAPIILYDYPRVAPESPGDFCDATEIDEMLSLRILTLTEAEKQEMRSLDAHARALLQRTESLTAEQLARLHGTMRSGSL